MNLWLDHWRLTPLVPTSARPPECLTTPFSSPFLEARPCVGKSLAFERLEWKAHSLGVWRLMKSFGSLCLSFPDRQSPLFEDCESPLSQTFELHFGELRLRTAFKYAHAAYHSQQVSLAQQERF